MNDIETYYYRIGRAVAFPRERLEHINWMGELALEAAKKLAAAKKGSIGALLHSADVERIGKDLNELLKVEGHNETAATNDTDGSPGAEQCKGHCKSVRASEGDAEHGDGVEERRGVLPDLVRRVTDDTARWLSAARKG